MTAFTPEGTHMETVDPAPGHHDDQVPAVPVFGEDHDQVATYGRHLPGNGADRRRLIAPRSRRPGISGVAYDTAWLAGLQNCEDRRASRFPSTLRWLADNQHADGSWGSSVRYEHDRILCTLAAVAPLAEFGRRSEDRLAVEKGTRYLWQHGHLIGREPVELVGFELLLPSLVDRARNAGVVVPPHLDVYAQERLAKLNLLPKGALYSPRTTVVHS